MRRVLTAAVLIALLVTAIEWLGSGFSVVFAAIVVLAGTWECLRLCERAGGRPLKGLAMLTALALAWSATGSEPRLDSLAVLWGGIALTLILVMWQESEPSKMLVNALHTLFPVVFVAFGLSYLVRLGEVGREWGRDLLYLLFVCVALADTAAFFVGSAIGKHRMAPSISPKKSWEGAVGGLTGSLLGGLAAHFWFFQELALVHALVLGVTLGLLGILGDLAESMLKRAVGAKDSSSLLPGHGGVLDRVDSLLFAGPFLYYYYLYVLGPGVTT